MTQTEGILDTLKRLRDDLKYEKRFYSLDSTKARLYGMCCLIQARNCSQESVKDVLFKNLSIGRRFYINTTDAKDEYWFYNKTVRTSRTKPVEREFAITWYNKRIALVNKTIKSLERWEK